MPAVVLTYAGPNPPFYYKVEYGSDVTSSRTACEPADVYAFDPRTRRLDAPSPVLVAFFDRGKYDLDLDALEIIQLAAARYKSENPVKLEVTGFSDLQGSRAVGELVSERRADAVANALVTLGVPPSRLEITWRGQNDLRVPNLPGVAECQNRRVEIIFPWR
jgi:outer membrane protein OmpA-like peptidoglycan-associated protein